MELGEILARTGAKSTGFEPNSGRSHGAVTSSDIAAAIGTIRNKDASALVIAKYIDQSPARFPVSALISKYHYACEHTIKRVDTIAKLASAALKFYIKAPHCRRCHGHAEQWDKRALEFVPCKTCLGSGSRTASVREIARLSGMSRSKLKKSHVRCFWEMHEILCTWESIAASQIKRALRK
jgi:hypothetical protein